MPPLPNPAALAIALLVLSGVFGLLERGFAARPRRSIWRRERRADFVWWFLAPLFSRAAVVCAVLALVLVGFDVKSPSFGSPWFRAQPLALQAIETLVAADLLGYWIHRAFHRRPLWRIHAVHHSSETLDWLAAVRVHPLNEAGIRVLQLVPLYLIGIDPRVLGAAVPFLTFYAVYLHANVSWDYGPLRQVIASPRFHAWHHTAEDEGLDRNFAGLFPWIDRIFGTLYLPAGRLPEVFGVRERVPESFFGQLTFPFYR
jgi:sterol desaturase/sphingolipid hydroxylase (fatty acid hydroxylase superfamily)